MLSEAGGAHQPFATYPCPFLEHFPSVSSVDLPVLPLLTSLHSLPFPWSLVAMEPLDCPCFTAPYWVDTVKGNGPPIGQMRPGRHPISAVEGPFPTMAVGPWYVH